MLRPHGTLNATSNSGSRRLRETLDVQVEPMGPVFVREVDLMVLRITGRRVGVSCRVESWTVGTPKVPYNSQRVYESRFGCGPKVDRGRRDVGDEDDRRSQGSDGQDLSVPIRSQPRLCVLKHDRVST